LAKHVLMNGFGIKDPDKFMMQQQPQQPVGPEGAPPGGAAPGAGPGAGQMPPGIPMGQPEGAFSPTGGVPPELLAQLQGQMGMELPFS